MADLLWFNVVDALKTLYEATLDIDVIDGPPIQARSAKSYVTVGWEPDADTAGDAGQSWDSSRGTYARLEQFDIVNYVDAWTGSTNDASVKARRDAAGGYLASIQHALRADPSLSGLLTSSPTGAQVTAYTIRQIQTDKGFDVGIVFHVTGSVRL